MTPDAAERSAFARALLAWFEKARRDLPWRRGYDPYQVWVSEVILQQTQMERGRLFFERFIARFPDVAALAAAGGEEVLKAWEGLGYYSRARNLVRAARRIAAEHGGRLPSSAAALRALPGIGSYTAAAVAAIAFNEPVIAVDANVLRVFSRLLDIDSPISSRGAHDYVRDTALACLPEGRARDFNQALMELGALVCRPRPECEKCPVIEFCGARRLGTQGQRPVRRPKPGRVRVEIVTGVLEHDGRVFIQKRPPHGIWAGMWEFPGGSLERGEEEAAALAREFQEETELSVVPAGKIADIPFTYTRYSAVMHAWRVRLAAPLPGMWPAPRLHAAVECAWISPRDFGRYAFPSGQRKLIALLT